MQGNTNTPMLDWDGKSRVFLDGSGRGISHELVTDGHVLDARMASLMMTSNSAMIVQDVCCILPHNETRNIFTKSSFAHFESMEKLTKKSTAGRGVCRQPVGTDRYMLIGTKPCRNGRGVLDGMGAIRSHPKVHKEFSRILRNIKHRAARWIDTLDLKSVTEAKKKSEYPGFGYSGGRGESGIWPAVACGRNTFLPLHTDMDYFLGAVTVCGKRVKDSDVLQYFCFPTLGISVELRNGDVLLFNPLVPHCISSPTDSQLDCFSFSAYLKSLVVSGNSNL